MARKKKESNTSLIALIFAIVSVISYNYYNKPEEIEKLDSNETLNIETIDNQLAIYYFDVGQADSILISNDNHYFLIDAGNNEDGKQIVDYLKNELNITKIDYVVGTHPHEDHIGGLDDIINNFEIDNIILPEVTTTTKTFEDVLDAIEKNNYEITVPKINEIYQLNNSSIEVIYTGTDEKNLNNCSIILKLTFGNTTYLFTGDTTSEIEKTILDQDLKSDVLKVAHHGSAYSTSNQFLLKVKPSYAIISVGKNNSYNHPSKDTLNRLTKFTDKIYQTSELGTILLTSDGNNIEITNIETNLDGNKE